LDGGEEMPNPYDMLARELKVLWDATFGSLFPSKEENKTPEKKNENPQKIKQEKKELPENSDNSQRTKEPKQSNTTPDNIKFVGNAKAEHVSEYTISILSNATVKANIDVISVTSTKRSAESQINAMYANVERTGVAYQLNEYGNKGDAVFLAYQEAKNAGASETEIKLAMLGKAEEVGFISTHMSSNYDKLNAVDVPYRNMTSKQEEAFKNTIKEQNNNIVIRKENNVLHLEIPQSEKK
jgi:hypothetical protein